MATVFGWWNCIVMRPCWPAGQPPVGLRNVKLLIACGVLEMLPRYRLEPYRLGAPEPWGDDLWFDLQPRFETTRSALGVHRCYPGTGCICIPSRNDIDALAGWVRMAELREITVSN